MMDDSRSNIPVPVKLIFLGTAAAAWAYAVRQKRRMEFAGKVVVISGASRGLGLELARGFAREKANIALLARDQERLTESAVELTDRKSTRLNSSHRTISYAVFCLKKKSNTNW